MIHHDLLLTFMVFAVAHYYYYYYYYYSAVTILAQGTSAAHSCPASLLSAMALSKAGLAALIARETKLKKKEVMTILDSLASVATKQVKDAGKVTIPGLFIIKTRVKPATKACERQMFGDIVVVKAKPAKTIVKAYCVAALKKSLAGNL